jgi:hypothetical protein
VHAVAGPVSTGFQTLTPLSVVGETAFTSLAQRLRSPSPSSSEEALGFRPLGLSESVLVSDDSINEGSVDGLRLPETAGEDSGGSGSDSQPDDDDDEKEGEKKEGKEGGGLWMQRLESDPKACLVAPSPPHLDGLRVCDAG